MDKLELEAKPRTILGKSVKTLRREGLTPIHLFGHDLESQALQADTAVLEKLIARAGTSHVITLPTDVHGKPHNTLVREVQRDPVSGRLLHVDFYALKASEKIKLEMPIHFTGEPLAVKNKKGLLLENIRDLEIECLPKDIPPSIDVDVTNLAEPGDTIHVEDLPAIPGVAILRNPRDVIAKIEEIRVEVEAKAPEAAAAKAEASEAEEKPAEGRAEKGEKAASGIRP